MNEKELIEKVALMWIENGGDEVSFTDSILDIHKEIMVLIVRATSNRQDAIAEDVV